MKLRRSGALALPLVLLAVAGCGSSSSSSSASGSSGSGSSGGSASSAGSSSSASGGSSSSGGAAAGATGAAGGTVSVTMRSLAFKPSVIHAKVGQTVQWTNQDSPPHNVTYVSGPRFASSPEVMNPGSKYSIKLTAAGTIHYFCSIHPFMKGTIVVTP